MSNPNPLVPQGSLLEQQARSKSTFQMAAFIVALHVVVLGGFLFLGCKKEENQTPTSSLDTFSPPPPVLTDTNTAAPFDTLAPTTNVLTQIPPVTNPVVPSLVPPVVDTSIPAPTHSVPTLPAAGSEHVVQKGEIAYALARKNGVTLKQMQDANPGKDLNKIKVGDKLQIPAPTAATAATGRSSGMAEAPSADGGTIHIVKGGDNLSRLAKKYGTTVKAIRDANGMTSNDIKVGKKLKIPARTSAGNAPMPASNPAPSAPFTPPVVTPASPVVTPGVPQ